MKRSRRDGRRLQYIAGRAALWLFNDLPAHMEAMMFPDHVRKQVTQPAVLVLYPSLTIDKQHDIMMSLSCKS